MPKKQAQSTAETWAVLAGRVKLGTTQAKSSVCNPQILRKTGLVMMLVISSMVSISSDRKALNL